MIAPNESEEELNAFVDGELSANDRARVLEALAQDASLQKRIAEIQQTRELLRHTYETPPRPPAAATTRFISKNNRLVVALSLAIGMVTGALLHIAAEQTPLLATSPKGVVIQVSEADPEKWKMALINASNVRKAYRNKNKEVGVEIVAYGPGLKMFRQDSPLAKGLAEANKNGVKLLACGNTMTMTRTSREELNPVVDIVPAGIVEIMERQQEGYAYVRP